VIGGVLEYASELFFGCCGGGSGATDCVGGCRWELLWVKIFTDVRNGGEGRLGLGSGWSWRHSKALSCINRHEGRWEGGVYGIS